LHDKFDAANLQQIHHLGFAKLGLTIAWDDNIDSSIQLLGLNIELRVLGDGDENSRDSFIRLGLEKGRENFETNLRGKSFVIKHLDGAQVSSDVVQAAKKARLLSRQLNGGVEMISYSSSDLGEDPACFDDVGWRPTFLDFQGKLERRRNRECDG
jgi:hypothetical protein